MKKRRIKRTTRITKQKREYLNFIKKHNIDLSYIEYFSFKNMIRRANIKGERLKKSKKSISKPKFTTNLDIVKTRDIYEKYNKALRRVLRRDYRKTEIEKWKANFIDNMRYQLGDSDEFDKFAEKFNDLTDEQIANFFKNNKELDSLIYGKYEETESELINILSISTENLNKRIKNL